MRGQPVVEAMKAARAFAAQRNPNAKLGVVFFNKKATVALAPTRDSEAIRAALARVPETEEGTRIYDALIVAAQQLRSTGALAGAIILLSDGADVGSKSSPEQAYSQLAGVPARVFSVGLNSPAYDPTTLRSLASRTGGAYSEAGRSTALSGIFSALGFRLSREYLLLYRSLATPEQPVKVVIKVDGYPALTTSYTTPALSLNATPFHRSLLGRVLVSWPFMFVVAIVCVGLAAWGVSTAVSARRRSLRTRIEGFVELDQPDFGVFSTQQLRDRLGAIGRRLERGGGLFQRFAEQCELADIEYSPAGLLVGSALAGLLLGALLSVAISPAMLLLIVLVPLAMILWVRRQVESQRKLFGEQLPDNLEVLASALRAGHSLLGGLATMTDNAAEPSKREFRRVLADEQLGVALDESLRRVGERMNNTDMKQVALIALLQRETGGSSAEVIDQVTTNIRGRMEVRRLVRTLTAQGRLARWIVSLMPVALVLAISLIYPAFLRPLFHETIGVVALVIGTLMVIAGSYVIKRIVEIKV